MDLDIKQLQALVELLQGGGTAGLLVFGFLMLRSFKELHEKIDRNNEARSRELAKIRERLVRIEVELEHVSERVGGKFKARGVDDDDEST